MESCWIVNPLNAEGDFPGGLVWGNAHTMKRLMNGWWIVVKKNLWKVLALKVTFQVEMSWDHMKVKMEELLAQTGTTYKTLNKTLDVTSSPQFEDHINLVKELQAKIIELQVRLQFWDISLGSVHFKSSQCFKQCVKFSVINRFLYVQLQAKII